MNKYKGLTVYLNETNLEIAKVISSETGINMSEQCRYLFTKALRDPEWLEGEFRCLGLAEP